MNIFLGVKLKYFRQIYYFTQLKRHQWLEEKDLIGIQEIKLRALINHAYQNVPFYRDLFNSVGVKPKDINSVNDLQKIPIISKEDIRKNYPNKILAKELDISNCLIRSTTGSCGMPLKVAFSPEVLTFQESVSFFAFFESGLRLTDKVVKIYHTDSQNNLFPKLFKKLGIFDWETISIFNSVESIIESLKYLNADVIRTYPSMLLLLSNEIVKQNIVGINPRLIITGGETLTDNSRIEISGVFNSDLRRVYGAEEFGHFAFECNQHSGLHIISDAVIAEVVKEEKKITENAEGEIVLTSLYNYAMPLIRYKLGDIVCISGKKCACGRGFPLITSIEGRADDFLILPSGKKISPRMINVIEDIPGVSMYKTVQETKNRIVVNLVKGKGFNDKTISEIKKNIKIGCLGEDVEVEVKLVEELPLERRGKLRAVVSNVKE